MSQRQGVSVGLRPGDIKNPVDMTESPVARKSTQSQNTHDGRADGMQAQTELTTVATATRPRPSQKGVSILKVSEKLE
ncbi:hypothetical protein DPEC_G00267430 [Dallia pectoralis]|uniref:Uncharacterized protein n=1 Tax=Dallia pectoralis TaxID=75939 RepID=A0ACC2FNL8_DALPE|nr:hypothetical protein DPEC_G00267430 [Dallia pectoralis]